VRCPIYPLNLENPNADVMTGTPFLALVLGKREATGPFVDAAEVARLSFASTVDQRALSARLDQDLQFTFEVALVDPFLESCRGAS